MVKLAVLGINVQSYRNAPAYKKENAGSKAVRLIHILLFQST